jgi:hypothetical protein
VMVFAAAAWGFILGCFCGFAVATVERRGNRSAAWPIIVVMSVVSLLFIHYVVTGILVGAIVYAGAALLVLWYLRRRYSLTVQARYQMGLRGERVAIGQVAGTLFGEQRARTLDVFVAADMLWFVPALSAVEEAVCIAPGCALTVSRSRRPIPETEKNQSEQWDFSLSWQSPEAGMGPQHWQVVHHGDQGTAMRLETQLITWETIARTLNRLPPTTP